MIIINMCIKCGMNIKKGDIKTMSKYGEDPSDKLINSKKLKSLFDLPDEISEENLPEKTTEKNIMEESKDINIDRKDPDDIIYDNIDRANRLLNRIEVETENGLTARLMEVASALINSITQASNSIVGSSQHEDEQRYKERVLELKEREVMIKESLGKGGGNSTVNNVLVTSREDLLKMMNKQNEEIEE